MRIAMWSPLPPEHSGIADYTYELLEALRELAEVTAVSVDPAHARVPAGVALAGPDAAGDSDAVHIYQMGNNTRFHEWIYRQALAVPGIVVLHDTSLLDFNLSYLGGLDSPAFRDEMRFAHGPIWGERDDPALLYGWPAVEADGVKHVDRVTMTFERRMVLASRGVIVHDPFRAEWLRQRYPHIPVWTVASGANPFDRDDRRTAVRARLGWQDGHVVFGVFGGFTRIKRILVAVLAFAQVRGRWPNARLLIVGHPREQEIADEVDALIAEQNLADSVTIVPGPDLDEFQDLMVATDALIGLRWPTAGETSAVMMRAFGAGRLMITSDLPQHRHLDPQFCWLVPTDPAAEAQRLIAHLEQIACWPEEARAAGRLAREYVREHASWPSIAAAYRDAAGAAPTDPPQPAEQPSGVNVFGDPRRNDEIGEAGRRYALALADSGVNLTFTEFNSRAPDRTAPVPPTLDDLRRGKDYSTDLWLIDGTAFHHVPRHALDRYTIGLWTMGGDEPSTSALAQLSRVDELWVPSSFVADAFRTATNVPITVVPQVVADPVGVVGDRARFGLPPDGLTVLCEFGMRDEARANPWAAIEAFRRAFQPADGACLVVNVRDGQHDRDLVARLARAVHDAGGRLLTTSDSDRLRASCDIYLSLHRVTDFGLGIAGAMALGKPAVATGFGGNVDFMPSDSAVLVGFDMRLVGRAYRPASNELIQRSAIGRSWAEPDVDQAARWLRRLAGSQRLRHTMGARGAAAIRSTCGPEAVAAVMERRLSALGSTGAAPRAR